MASRTSVRRPTLAAATEKRPRNLLGEQLRTLGLQWTRLKTGTPPRLDGRTIDWSQFEPQPGDPDPTPFSFLTEKIDRPQIACHIGYTTEETRRILQANISRSPLYSGQIDGIGPRYCPSIEDKIVKFPDKPHSPDLSRTGGPRYQRGLRERHVHQHAHRRAGGHGGLDTRARTRRDDPTGLCHRVRRHRSARTAAHSRSEIHCGPFSRRPDQRHFRIRGSRMPRDRCRHECGLQILLVSIP